MIHFKVIHHLQYHENVPYGQRHVAINIYNICKGHFGSRGWGEASKIKLKDTSFIFPMTNVTILGVFRTQKKYGKVLEMKSILSGLIWVHTVCK